jgi:tripartite-type tricarboxylate transporter receptor subunit TctC
MELLKLTAKIDLVHVPYKGSAGAVSDVIAGHVGVMFMPVHTALPLMQSNQIRALAVGGAKRSSVMPSVPTLAEEGVADFDVDLWYGLLAPAGTPADIVNRYNAAVNEILTVPEVVQTLAAQGLTPAGGPPERLADLIKRDLPAWARVIKDAGITAE